VPPTKRLLCPICNGKTRTDVLRDTIMENFPLFCPKCKSTTIVTVKHSSDKGDFPFSMEVEKII